MIRMSIVLRRMYGTRTKEQHIVGYTSAYTGQYYPPKVIPAGYTGLIQGSIYREDDGMEVTDEYFLEQPADYHAKMFLPPDNQTVGALLHNLVSRLLESHIGIHAEVYNWSVEVSTLHGICINFFLPEKVPILPLLKFQHDRIDYYIEFTDVSGPSSQEYDEDYDY